MPQEVRQQEQDYTEWEYQSILSKRRKILIFGLLNDEWVDFEKGIDFDAFLIKRKIKL